MQVVSSATFEKFVIFVFKINRLLYRKDGLEAVATHRSFVVFGVVRQGASDLEFLVLLEERL